MSSTEKVEKFATPILAMIGVAAIITQLAVEELTLVKVLEATRNLAALLITLALFLMTWKIFQRGYGGFRQRFEKLLQEWVEDNCYLVDSLKKTSGKKDPKEFYFMLTKPNHTNMLVRDKKASEFPDSGGRVNVKGAFLYTDPNDKQEIVFGLNRSFFIEKAGAELPNGMELADISEALMRNLEQDFGSELSLGFSRSKDGTRITVSLSETPRTEKSARRLVDMVDSAKALILAAA